LNLNKLTPLLQTKNLQKTIDWYVEILGFTCTDNVPEYGFARVQLHNADLMLATPNAHMEFKEPHFTGSFYINTNNVDTWWEKLKDKCRVCYPVETFDYGMREFAIYEINGYLLQFGQSMMGENKK